MDQGVCCLRSEELTYTTDAMQVQKHCFHDGSNMGHEGEGSVKNHCHCSDPGKCCEFDITFLDGGNCKLRRCLE